MTGASLGELRRGLDRVEFARAVGLEPEEWQAKLLRSKSNRIILNCSRQSGKSSFSAIIALHTALYFRKKLVLVFAPALRQSQEFFQKVDRFWKALGLPGEADSERKLGLELKNGSRIEALPGSERTTRGFSAPSLIIFEEAARIDDSLYYEGARPMLATVPESTLLLISSPYGKRGFFYEEWTNGVGWERHRITADESEAVKPSYIEEERQIKTERQMCQEYYCQFTQTEDAVFHDGLIEAAFVDEPPLWSDYAVDGVAQYYYDANVEQWRSAEDLALGRPRRTLAEIERDIDRAICGAPGFNPERLLKEFEEAKQEEEASGD